MTGRRFRSAPLLVATGVIAAAVADPLVESLSNAGLFGAGYRDDDHVGVVPALLAGIALAVALATPRFRAIWRHVARSHGIRLVDVAREQAARRIVADVPIVLGVQLVAVYAIESGEHLLAAHRMTSGVAWLGGPVAGSLAIQATVGVGCTLLLRSLSRTIVRAFAAFAVAALLVAWLASRVRSGAALSCRRDDVPRHARSASARLLPSRAPPAFLLVVRAAARERHRAFVRDAALQLEPLLNR